MSATMGPALRTRAIALALVGVIGTSTAGCGGGSSESSSAGVSATLEWSAVHLGVGDGSVMSLATDGTLAVALVSGAERTIWSSTDGHAWQREQALGTGAYPNKLAGGPGGFLIVGQRQEQGMTFVGSMWTSPDGHAWAQADLPDPSTPTLGVAIGTDGTALFMGDCPSSSKADLTEALCGGTLRNGEWKAATSPSFANGVFSDVAARSGRYVVVGQVRGSGIPGSGAVWTSSDGLSWERATPDSFASVLFWGAAITPSSMVSVGGGYPGLGSPAAAFRSKDGQTWTALPDIPDVLKGGAGTGMLRGAAELPDGRLVVAGVALSTTASGLQSTPLILVLGSNEKWEVVREAAVPISQSAASGDYELRSVMVLQDRVLVGGADADGAVIWVGEPAP